MRAQPACKPLHPTSAQLCVATTAAGCSSCSYPLVQVGSLPSGEMDYNDLATALAANTTCPAILNMTVGATMTGAIDALDRILGILEATGYPHDRFFLHCNCALFGTMLPGFLMDVPLVTFAKPIGAVSVSGHKFIGAPMPCGVVITRTKYVQHLDTRDVMVMGSRNGHAPIHLWYTLAMKGFEGIGREVEMCMRNARTLKGLLEKAGVGGTMLNEFSNLVVFERPVEEAFVRKWQLSCQGGIAHIAVMPNLGVGMLGEFVRELQLSRARTGAHVAAEGDC
jgi:histidine decarboxylase